MGNFVANGQRWRAIWSTFHFRELSETFHEFLVSLAYSTLGDQWVKDQVQLPTDQRHVVVNWFEALHNLHQFTPKTAKGGYIVSGPAHAAIAFAYDLYFLQLVNKLPHSLVDRLRDPVSFQGARYEVSIAAVFAHADFEITLLDEAIKKDKHCEFIARHKRTGTEVYVEAKSRRRRGVLNEPGTFADTNIKGDVFGLYQSALTQAPPNNPFFIFIDANLPTSGLKWPTDGSSRLPMEKSPWMIEIKKRLEDDWAIEGLGKTRDTVVVVTNFAPYYGPETKPSSVW